MLQTIFTAPRPPRRAQQDRPAAWQRRALLAWGCAALLFAAVLAVYGVCYDTNDDATIANIAAGAYGPDRLRLVHVSVVVGAVLRPLYALVPGWNWYVLVSLALMLGATAALAYLALERFGTARGLALFWAAALVFGPEMLCRFQYVRTTAVCMAAGLCWLAVRLGQGARRVAPGVALAAVGSMIRWEMFCAAGGLSAALLLGRFFVLDKAARRRAVAAMAALFALVGAAKAVDIAAYQLDDGWRAYRAYNDARTEFSDYKVQLLPYGRNVFAPLGVSDLDNALLLEWDFYDGTVFSTERLQQLNAAVPPKGLWQAAKETLYLAAHNALDMLRGQGNARRWALVLLLAAGLLLARGRALAPFWGTAGLLAAEIAFLIWRARWARYVEASLLLTAVVFLLACLAQAPPARPRRRGAAAAAVAAAALVLTAACLPELAALYGQARQYHTSRPGWQAPYDAMSADKEHLYLLGTANIDAAAGYDVWHPRPAGYFSNLVAVGGWLSHSPHREAALAAYGAQRPVVDAVDNARVLLSGANIDHLAAYAAEQLGCPVRAVAEGRCFRLVRGG